MWEAIASNKFRSRILLFLMTVLLLALGTAIGYAYAAEQGAVLGTGIAALIAVIMLPSALFGGDRILLASMGASEVQKEDAPRLYNVVEEMKIASGLPAMPRIYLIEDSTPNAFAVGRKPAVASVAVTSGLLRRLSLDELQGVIAHEIGHIHNYDIRFMTLAAVLMGSIAMVSDIFLRSIFHGAGPIRMGRRSREDGGAQAIMAVVAIVLAILAPFLAQLLYLAASRRREYLADASSARFTRFPEGLASALEKIASGGKRLALANRAVAPLFIVNPLRAGSDINLFSTHPPTEKRVAILRSMAGSAGLQAYEEAYRKVAGERKHMIGEQSLAAEATPIPIRAPSAPEPQEKDAVERAREALDFLDRAANFALIPCACGVRIKIPPQFRKESVNCPSCGRSHEVPRAATATADSASPAEASAPLEYARRTPGKWESFRCDCGKTIQLSPAFLAPRTECPSCKRRILIKTP